MSKIRRVLFPVDLSSYCQTLAPAMQEMIDRWRAEITLLHVMEARPWPSRGNTLERLTTQLEFLARSQFGSTRIRRRIERGNPAERILNYIQSNHIDAVVLQTHGSYGLDRSPLGRVTEEVVTAAPCTVCVDWTPCRQVTARRVCCAVDLDETGEAVLGQAAQVAAELRSTLTIACAITPGPRNPALLWDSRAREREIQAARTRIDYWRREVAPAAVVHVGVGDRRSVISRVLQEQETGLLVIGRGREMILAAESQCPVLRVAVAGWLSAHAPEPGAWHVAAAMGSA